ncbi:MAG: TlpA disulfide reductase family protein [Bryobacteraceae bacterium]
MASAKQKRTLEAGSRAPEVPLHRMDSDATSLNRLRAGSSPVLLTFFKVSCPTCQYTLPFLERVHKKVEPEQLAMYSISQDDAEATREFNAEFGIEMPALLDLEESQYPASDAFGVTSVPSMFLVEPDGRISWASVGFDKKDLLRLAARLGVEIFRPEDYVPEWKAG